MPRRAALALICALLILRLPSLVQPMGPDQGLYAYVGERILHGELAYRDAWDQKPPAIHYVYAALRAAAHRDVVVPAADLFAALIVAVLLWRIGARLGGGEPATLSTRGMGRPSPVPSITADVATAGTLQLSPRSVRVLAIGASTGGPQALNNILAELPPDFAPAVVVVQHMAEGFVEGLASWLDTTCALPVSVSGNGKRLLPGTVTIAPSGLNLIVHDQLRVTTHEPPASQYHVPGIDATLMSVADSVGREAVGVLLTGMGRDGAAGMKCLRDAGAFTIAQDEQTSAVYGMPAAAVALEAADMQLPLEDIGTTIRRLVMPTETGGAS